MIKYNENIYDTHAPKRDGRAYIYLRKKVNKFLYDLRCQLKVVNTEKKLARRKNENKA